MVNNWMHSLQWLLFPPTCMVCGGAGLKGRDLCQACMDALPINSPCCSRCALPIPQPGVCGGCLKHRNRFDACFVPYLYSGAVPRLITGHKFNGRLQAGRVLSELLMDQLQMREITLPELLIPVPLHKARLRQRGFNQALEMAKRLGKGLQLPVDFTSCQRILSTPAQSTLAKKARKKNLRGAFEQVKPLTQRHVALIDDVMTTGSTVNEMAKVLKRGGVECVDVWCLARTP